MIADDASLARFMALAQAGDRVAYATLLRECERWLTRYYARRVAPCHAEDLVQDTLISLHRKLASYDPSRPFFPWIAAIARYRWIDHLRKIYRADETVLPDDIATPSGETAIHARISLDQLLQQLPSPQARAIELVKIEGRSIAEAATVTGQSESLIKVNIHRGLKKLTSLIESE
jgi:RNA polymerase sigma factor (sigma-70 family)